MNMLYVLIALAVLMLTVAVTALVVAIRGRQFEDLDSQGWSVVIDEDLPVSDSDEPTDRTPGATTDD